ncbi:hypothetical protein [Sphingomonas sp.]|uniref:hypothetical protein n=1 Tax=Sphingomonas sp. TaxID=28214 RepID=UPI003D6D2584
MFWRYLVAALAFTTASAAKADYWTPQADIVCSRHDNVAVIRFGGAWSGGGSTTFRTLPHRIDGGLSQSRASNRTNCRLPNGWRLRLRDGQKQAFAYGAGGADPPAFFSLWIERRHIFSAKEWKPHYDAENQLQITALVVRPNRLTWCRAQDEGPQLCTDEPFRLDKKYRVDTTEYPANGRKRKVGTLLATSGEAPNGFCRQYLKAMRAKMLDDVAFSYALSGHESAPFAWDLTARAQSFPKSDIRQADIDIAPGVRRRLLLWHGENHFFDGDVVLVLPQGTSTAKLLPQIDFPGTNPDVLALGEARGWTRLIGGSRNIYPRVSPRYVHFVPERIKGRLYFLASPTSLDERPTAILLGLRPKGGSRVMCRIQRVEPHF